MKLSNDLRQSVLQAAMEGKLTEQLKEDGNADDLLKVINEERTKLVKEKKIKKSKPLPQISEDEIPFDIPENWRWIRLNECGAPGSFADGPFGSNLKKIHYTSKKEVRIIQLSNIGEFYWKDKNEKYTTYKHLESIKRCEVHVGDFVIAKMMPAGRAMIMPEIGTKVVLGSDAVKFTPLSMICSRYLHLAINSPMFQSQVYADAKGITRVRTSLTKLKSYILPLPPLAEQHRIVEKIDALMAEIDELEKKENELEKLKKEFPEDMKVSLLQTAMEGKLTEQLPEDGDARDLLAQIKAEKERLIKEKKIKKKKPLKPISEDEVPFDVPKNWKWCYLGDIFNHNAGKALNARNTKGEKHKYITTSNVYWDHFELDNLREMYYTPDEVEKYSVRKGDLLVLEGGDIGRTAIWDRDETYCVQNHVHRLRPYLKVDVKYFYYCMMYYKNSGIIYGKGIAIQGLSANALHCINIPLPPLAEQHRIVERLDKLLPLCDSLQVEL